jgi:DNA mismatch endonuclease, patch repair protein
MSRVKGKDTDLEIIVRQKLDKLGFTFDKNVKDLPGKPDIVFRTEQVAIFLDGDFWHGYLFPVWEKTIPPFWQDKIGKTRKRDQRTYKKLRRRGWKVIRLWQHQIHKDLDSSIKKITEILESRRSGYTNKR